MCCVVNGLSELTVLKRNFPFQKSQAPSILTIANIDEAPTRLTSDSVDFHLLLVALSGFMLEHGHLCSLLSAIYSYRPGLNFTCNSSIQSPRHRLPLAVSQPIATCDDQVLSFLAGKDLPNFGKICKLEITAASSIAHASELERESVILVVNSSSSST